MIKDFDEAPEPIKVCCQNCRYQLEEGPPAQQSVKCFTCAQGSNFEQVSAEVTFREGEEDPSGKDPHEPGAKLDAGKIKAGVLKNFGLALLKVAEVGTFGADKYTRGGWQEVENGQERYEDAKWRHLLKADQEPVDEESGIDHLAHEAWNALAVLELKLREEKSNE